MTLQDQIASFLRGKRMWPYCDECIHRALAYMRGEDIALDEVRGEIEEMKGQFGFLPGHAVCTGCGERKPTIMAS
jgi:hypothetical protein